MTARAFRFIHAADLHLDQPLAGLSQIPESIRSLLIDAPLVAAERVFDAAIDRNVEFVVLAGNVVNPLEAGTNGLSRLVDQFRRLEKNNIAVYWVAGGADALDRWHTVDLPANVHLFGSRGGDRLTHQRGKETVATIIGFSGVEPDAIRAKDLKTSADERFSTGIACGRATAASLAKTKVDYWALGGQAQRETLCESPVAHYPGTTQGRSPIETGVGGCTLVEVDAQQKIHLKQIATDVVRWHAERLEARADAKPSDLKEAIADRVLSLADNAGERALLVTWRIAGPARAGNSNGYRALADELIAWLRKEFAETSPVVWPVSLEFDPPSKMPKSWREEDTILGEFLRSIQHYVDNPNEPIALNEYLSDELAESLATAVRLEDPATRSEVLREATLMGVDLLHGEEAA